MPKSKRNIDEVENDSDASNVEYSDEEIPKSKKSKKEKVKAVDKSTISEEQFWSVSGVAVLQNQSMGGN